MERLRPGNLRNAFVIAGLTLSGCVSKPSETPVPRVEPTAMPTLEPAPTQVPEYIGLPADEIEALRQECLAVNPDSLCLPLPVDPTLPGFSIEKVEFVHNYFIQDQKYEVEETYLSTDIPSGAAIVTPIEGDLQVEYNYAYIGSNVEELFLTEICLNMNSLSLCLRTRDGSPLAEDMFRSFGGSRRVSDGEILVEIASDNLALGIWDFYEESLPSGDQILRSDIAPDGLLQDHLGRWVYISGAARKAWTLVEAFSHVAQSCKTVDVNPNKQSQVAGYVRSVAERAGLPVEMYGSLGVLFDPESGCAIVGFNPPGEPGLFIYENGEGFVQVLRTVPLR